MHQLSSCAILICQCGKHTPILNREEYIPTKVSAHTHTHKVKHTRAHKDTQITNANSFKTLTFHFLESSRQIYWTVPSDITSNNRIASLSTPFTRLLSHLHSLQSIAFPRGNHDPRLRHAHFHSHSYYSYFSLYTSKKFYFTLRSSYNPQEIPSSSSLQKKIFFRA